MPAIKGRSDNDGSWMEIKIDSNPCYNFFHYASIARTVKLSISPGTTHGVHLLQVDAPLLPTLLNFQRLCLYLPLISQPVKLFPNSAQPPMSHQPCALRKPWSPNLPGFPGTRSRPLKLKALQEI